MPADDCGTYGGEVLEIGGDYSAWQNVRAGESYAYCVYPCGGLLWLDSSRWIPPTLDDGCGGPLGPDISGIVPISISGSYFGALYPNVAATGDGPPGIEDADILDFVGSGMNGADVTWDLPADDSFDYWHPEVGSRWTGQVWARCVDETRSVSVGDNILTILGDVTGADVQIGWGTYNRGYRAHAAGEISTSWQFFQHTFTIEAPWGSAAAAGPQMPVLGVHGSELESSTTLLVQWPTTGTYPDCGPSSGASDHYLSKRGPHGIIQMACPHFYPEGEVPTFAGPWIVTPRRSNLKVEP